MLKSFLLLFTTLIFCRTGTNAQEIPVNDQSLNTKYPFISTVFNRIQNNTGLDSFYYKLSGLKKKETGSVSIVHIGDSHIQPDFLTAVVRNGFQSFFGNAGRGMVFPYQLAQSNTPDDIRSQSAIRWNFNRLAHPEIALPFGISGYGITTADDSAAFEISLRPPSVEFDRIRLFAGKNSNWLVQTSKGDFPVEMDSSGIADIQLEEDIVSFRLASGTPGIVKEFYGASLENAGPGVLYHSIGVNGARYDQYNIASLFWEQLPSLKADIYIISLGTNEAQRTVFSEISFTRELDDFIRRLKISSPGAAILITSVPDSYKGRYSNKILQQVNQSLAAYCSRNYIPFWDLYRITNGYGSAYSWARRGLMSRDRIHFTSEGYRLMGTLLFNALARGYNSFISMNKDRYILH